MLGVACKFEICTRCCSATMTVFDVIVVGAGVEGSATAYQLIKHGAKRVLLLEQVKIKTLFQFLHNNLPYWMVCMQPASLAPFNYIN